MLKEQVQETGSMSNSKLLMKQQVGEMFIDEKAN